MSRLLRGRKRSPGIVFPPSTKIIQSYLTHLQAERNRKAAVDSNRKALPIFARYFQVLGTSTRRRAAAPANADVRAGGAPHTRIAGVGRGREMVGVAGFEPATPSSRTRCAT